MEIRPGIDLPDDALVAFASHHGIRRLALFGSALGPGFTPASDIDLLVEFAPGRTPGLLAIAGMELELQELLDGQEVELRTEGDLGRYFRDGVRKDARPIFDAA